METRIRLDQALELIDNIKYSFEPECHYRCNGGDRFGNADVS